MKTIYRCGCVAKDGQVKSTCVTHAAFVNELKSDLEETIAEQLEELDA